ncbi:hypothetical protein B0H17DRAFT_1072751 [Mycena rosella]|uniref:Uncharacterized protein n=1 Tax=Mycena rosella TaxID=1033263 RepID=A0AAD7D9S6_MYCRO|nr:hypothetical protein B0H17DRAFT_1072751 [Mycena rosella]
MVLLFVAALFFPLSRLSYADDAAEVANSRPEVDNSFVSFTDRENAAARNFPTLRSRRRRPLSTAPSASPTKPYSGPAAPAAPLAPLRPRPGAKGAGGG